MSDMVRMIVRAIKSNPRISIFYTGAIHSISIFIKSDSPFEFVSSAVSRRVLCGEPVRRNDSAFAYQILNTSSSESSSDPAGGIESGLS